MKKRTKGIIFIAAVMALLLAGVGMTVAYLMDATEEVVNTFTPSTVTSEVDEDFDDENTVKKDVKIQNTGDIDAYIRAAVVITWQDKDGNVYPQTPVAGTDYSITWSKTGWVDGNDGYYYYSKKVGADAKTGVLISECQPLKAAPAEGYTLHVEILGSAIQAEPDEAVKSAWGVTVATAADGTKTISKNG